MTSVEETTLRDTIINLVEDKGQSLHVEYLTDIDREIMGATGHQSGYFWMLKDESGAVLRMQRIIVFEPGDMRDSAYERPASEVTDLNDDVVRNALVILLNEIREDLKKEEKMKYVGEYDFSRLTDLIGKN
jgi:hypothetical protein